MYELFEAMEMDKYKAAFEVGCSGCFGIVVVDTPDVSSNLINHGSKYIDSISLDAVHNIYQPWKLMLILSINFV